MKKGRFLKSSGLQKATITNEAQKENYIWQFPFVISSVVGLYELSSV